MSETAVHHMFDRFLWSARRYEEKWRKSNERNFAYVDGDQWTDEERFTINSRGQQATVINTIAPTIDMICSVANDRQVDIQVCGREESDDAKGTLLTALLRHVFDTENFEYFHKAGFREALISGRSWFECGKYTDERGKDMLKVELVPWEDVYIDPHSKKPDGSDARFIIKVKWLDRDVVKKLFPDAAGQIDGVFTDDYKGQEYAAQQYDAERADAFYYDCRSHRVRVCECYYTMPERKTVQVTDEETGRKVDKEVSHMALHYVVFSDNVILQGSLTDHSRNRPPLDIDYYPLVPMYCTRDRYGRPRGVVSNLIDIQDQINKLNSKFIWTLQTNRIIAEEGALKDPDEAKEEFQRPDGLVMLNDGGLSKVRVDEKYRDLSYMSNHLQFLLATEQRISGVNDSMLGIGGTNERSGTMQSARISQGAAMQTTILENMYFSKERIALVMLRLIGRWYTDYRVIRVTQPNGVSDEYRFNYRDEYVDPRDGKPHTRILNEIGDTLYYDVILKKVAPFTSMRERQLQIFSEVLKAGIIPAPVAAKLLLSLSDIPNKEDMVMEVEQVYAAQQQALQQDQAAQQLQAQAQAQGIPLQ